MEVRILLLAGIAYLLWEIKVELDALKAEVARGTTVKESVRALITAMKTRLDELANNATDLATLKAGILAETAKLDADHDEIEAAVVENTPSA